MAIPIAVLSLITFYLVYRSMQERKAARVNSAAVTSSPLASSVTSEDVKKYGLNIYNDLFNVVNPVENFTSTSGVRGIRNNNPGNIRLGANWQGMREEQTDGAFVQFVEPKYGIRAMARIIDNYKKRGVTTVEQIISTWAPPIENNTQSYVRSVAQKTGWPSFYEPEKSRGDYLPLIKAIIFHENGQQPYSDATINTGIGMA